MTTARMTELQALVSGYIAGALATAELFACDVEVPSDANGNYLPEILVRGRVTGERLRVRVDVEYAEATR
jgi:hypothetical protein